MFTLIRDGCGRGLSLQCNCYVASPGIFPPSFSAHGKIGVYFEAAAVITVLVLLGQVLELRARNRYGSAIRALLKLAPNTAHLVRNGTEEHDVTIDRCPATRSFARASRREGAMMDVSSKDARASMSR